MPKTLRFHEPAYSNEYGYFQKDTVYTDVPDDFNHKRSGVEVLSSTSEIGEMDNVTTKNYDGLITSGITKAKKSPGSKPKAFKTKMSTSRRPQSAAQTAQDL
jgi:hypothetical protein